MWCTGEVCGIKRPAEMGALMHQRGPPIIVPVVEVNGTEVNGLAENPFLPSDSPVVAYFRRTCRFAFGIFVSNGAGCRIKITKSLSQILRRKPRILTLICRKCGIDLSLKDTNLIQSKSFVLLDRADLRWVAAHIPPEQSRGVNIPNRIAPHILIQMGSIGIRGQWACRFRSRNTKAHACLGVRPSNVSWHGRWHPARHRCRLAIADIHRAIRPRVALHKPSCGRTVHGRSVGGHGCDDRENHQEGQQTPVFHDMSPFGNHGPTAPPPCQTIIHLFISRQPHVPGTGEIVPRSAGKSDFATDRQQSSGSPDRAAPGRTPTLRFNHAPPLGLRFERRHASP